MMITNTSISGNNTTITSSNTSVTNSKSNSLQNQLTLKEQHLDKIASDSKLSEEEKAKAKKELQQQIAELNRKIRQMRLEQQTEEKEATKATLKEQQKATENKEAMANKAIADDAIAKEEKKQNLLEAGSDKKQTEKQLEEDNQVAVTAQKILSSNFEMQQALLQNGIYKREEQTKNILESEIKTSKLTGNDTSKKEEQLSQLEEKVNIITAIQQGQEDSDPYTMNPNAKIIIRE